SFTISYLLLKALKLPELIDLEPVGQDDGWIEFTIFHLLQQLVPNIEMVGRCRTVSHETDCPKFADGPQSPVDDLTAIRFHVHGALGLVQRRFRVPEPSGVNNTVSAFGFEIVDRLDNIFLHGEVDDVAPQHVFGENETLRYTGR